MRLIDATKFKRRLEDMMLRAYTVGNTEAGQTFSDAVMMLEDTDTINPLVGILSKILAMGEDNENEDELYIIEDIVYVIKQEMRKYETANRC